MKKAIGEMLRDVIYERKINQVALCRGICSASALSRYLRGERRMDWLLLTALMQRLGKNPEHFNVILTDDEYQYFEWKQRICYMLAHKDWQAVELCLQEKQAIHSKCNKVLQEQFFLFMCALVQEKKYLNRGKSICILEKAIMLTIPDFSQALNEFTLLSVQEISIILFWQDLLESREQAFKVVKLILECINRNYQDEQEKEMIFPHIALKYINMLLGQKQYWEGFFWLRKSIQMVQNTGYASNMEVLLAIYVDIAEKLGLNDELTEKKKELEAWKELSKEVGIENNDCAEEILQLRECQGVELIREIINLYRQERHYSQMQLSENICTPESISRIENGNRAPNRKTFQALANKLSFPIEYYYSVVDTDDFKVLELGWKFECCATNKDLCNAEKFLERLRSKIDLSIACNKQFVEVAQYIIDKEAGKITNNERFTKLIEILGYTVTNLPLKDKIYEWPEYFWIHFFRDREMYILILIAEVMAENAKMNQAIDLLEKMLKYYGKSKVKLEFHSQIILLILERLSIYCNKISNYNGELMYSDLGIELCFACEQRKKLANFLESKAEALKELGDELKSKKYYKLAFYCAKVMKSELIDLNI